MLIFNPCVGAIKVNFLGMGVNLNLGYKCSNCKISVINFYHRAIKTHPVLWATLDT